MHKITKGEKTIYFQIVTKPIKHVYFRVKNQVLFVSKNKRTQEQVIYNYIEANFDKIYTKTSVKKIETQSNEMMIFGQKYHVNYQFGLKFNYEIKNDRVTISALEDQDYDTLKRLVLLDLLIQKTKELDRIIQPIIEKQGISLLPYKYKWLKSKFGSYHRINKEITLNIFLATIDSTFLMYVLLHEYAHVKVFNHQKPFYDLLDKMSPGHKAVQKALKKHHI